MILGLCPKPHRSALAILQSYPHALRYRLTAIVPSGAAFTARRPRMRGAGDIVLFSCASASEVPVRGGSIATDTN